MNKRIVVWGTGVVGKMVIAQIVRHPNFETRGRRTVWRTEPATWWH